MHRFVIPNDWRFALFLLILSMGKIATAQDHRSGMGWLLDVSGIAEELELTQSQRDDLQDFSDLMSEEYRNATTELTTALQQEGLLGQNADKEKLKVLAQELNEAIDDVWADERKQLSNILLDKQLRRLDELHVQALGLNPFFLKRVLTELKIEGEQLKDLGKEIIKQSPKVNRQQQIVFALTRNLRSDRAKKKAAEAKEKLEALEKEAEEAVFEVLKRSQMIKFKKLRGKKFDFAEAARKLAEKRKKDLEDSLDPSIDK